MLTVAAKRCGVCVRRAVCWTSWRCAEVAACSEALAWRGFNSRVQIIPVPSVTGAGGVIDLRVLCHFACSFCVRASKRAREECSYRNVFLSWFELPELVAVVMEVEEFVVDVVVVLQRLV